VPLASLLAAEFVGTFTLYIVAPVVGASLGASATS
jgi:hypothetical protein